MPAVQSNMEVKTPSTHPLSKTGGVAGVLLAQCAESWPISEPLSQHFVVGSQSDLLFHIITIIYITIADSCSLTQNANESLHSKLWLKCLKVKDAKLDRLHFNALNTVLCHNFGDEYGSLLAKLGHQTEEAKTNSTKRDSSWTPVKTPRKQRCTEEPGLSSDYAAGAFWIPNNLNLKNGFRTAIYTSISHFKNVTIINKIGTANACFI